MEKGINICLNYHDFSGTGFPSVKSEYTVEKERFCKQLDLLTGIRNVSLIELLLPSTLSLSYCLTFDDGYKSGLYIAEELTRRNIKGTFFIIKDKSVQDVNYLNKYDIRTIRSMGHQIGSHSCSHCHLNRLKKEKLIHELVASKSFLEDILSEKVNAISFPGGHFSSREIRASTEAGYLLKRTCISGVNHIPLREGLIKSMNVKRCLNEAQFTEIINLSTGYFLKEKFREIILSIPKYIESRILFG